MSNNVKVVLNKSAVRDLLRSNSMEAAVKEVADGISNRAGDGYSVDTHVGKSRVNASVFPKTVKAKRDNQKNNTLLRSLK